MTAKQALEYLSQEIAKHPPIDYEKLKSALLTVGEALERLTPKPPRQKAVSSLSSKDKTIYKGFCPHCKDDNYVYSFHPCCSMCGQAIDWSEHNAEG